MTSAVTSVKSERKEDEDEVKCGPKFLPANSEMQSNTDSNPKTHK